MTNYKLKIISIYLVVFKQKQTENKRGNVMKKSEELMKKIARVAMDKFLKGHEFDLHNIKWFPMLRILSEVERELLSSLEGSEVKFFSAFELLECFLQCGFAENMHPLTPRTKIYEFLELMQISEIPESAGVKWLYDLISNELDSIQNSLGEIIIDFNSGDDQFHISYNKKKIIVHQPYMVIKLAPNKERLTGGRSVFDTKRILLSCYDNISLVIVKVNGEFIECCITRDLVSCGKFQYILLEKKNGFIYWTVLKNLIAIPW